MPSSHGPASPSAAASNCAAAARPAAAISFLMRTPRCQETLRGTLVRPCGPRPALCYRLGLDQQMKLATSFRRIGSRFVKGTQMTYCCGVLVRDGMVMIADTRTNAGL